MMQKISGYLEIRWIVSPIGLTAGQNYESSQLEVVVVGKSNNGRDTHDWSSILNISLVELGK